MTPEQRINSYTDAPENIQLLYSSDTATSLNKQMQQKYRLSESQFSNYLDVTGDTILGFHHTKDLPRLLQKEVGLSADEAQRVVADLAEFLSPVLEREQQAGNEKKSELEQISQQFAPGARAASTPADPLPEPTATTDAPTENTPANEPADVHDVVPMRTMQGDMQRIHGYGAYREQYPADTAGGEAPVYKSEQSATLKKEPLVGTPEVEE